MRRHHRPKPRPVVAETRTGQTVGGGTEAAIGATPRPDGVPVVAVSFGYNDVPLAELGADALIDHFAELPAVARRLLEPRRAAISPILPGRTDA